MRLWDNLKDRVREMKEKQLEKRDFQRLVSQETLPIRRQGYLEQKKRQAIEEGRMIAQKELQKQLSTEDILLKTARRRARN